MPNTYHDVFTSKRVWVGYASFNVTVSRNFVTKKCSEMGQKSIIDEVILLFLLICHVIVWVRDKVLIEERLRSRCDVGWNTSYQDESGVASFKVCTLAVVIIRLEIKRVITVESLIHFLKIPTAVRSVVITSSCIQGLARGARIGRIELVVGL
jgi:hypothetical protein